MLVFDVLLMTNLWQFRFQFILSISSWFSSICQQHFIHCLGFLNFYEWHLSVSFRCQNFAFDIMCNVWCVVSVFARTFHWKCVNCILFIIANNMRWQLMSALQILYTPPYRLLSSPCALSKQKNPHKTHQMTK